MTPNDVLFYACCAPEVASETGANYRDVAPADLAGAVAAQKEAILGRFREQAALSGSAVAAMGRVDAAKVASALAAYHLSWDGQRWAADGTAIAARDERHRAARRAEHEADEAALAARLTSQIAAQVARRQARAMALGKPLGLRQVLLLRLALVDRMLTQQSSSGVVAALEALRDEIEADLPATAAPAKKAGT